jgi:hypothetical protein
MDFEKVQSWLRLKKRCLGAQKRKKLAVQAAAQMKPARLST